ncbi:MAG: hypothetical protein JWM55_792 [Acidimicrobiaceae bacterium]|nr:hypothetical protein [Acidimicrobiaceae bacterium]
MYETLAWAVGCDHRNRRANSTHSKTDVRTTMRIEGLSVRLMLRDNRSSKNVRVSA